MKTKTVFRHKGVYERSQTANLDIAIAGDLKELWQGK